MERKQNLCGDICRMKEDRRVKKVMFGTMDGQMRRKGRPCGEWIDIKKWGGEEIHILSRTARVERWCGRHRTATGGETMEQWMTMDTSKCYQCYITPYTIKGLQDLYSTSF